MSKNAVIYARYSSSNQREESIDGQIRECRAFAETNGYAIVNIYIDRALSARTDNRPEFLRMVQDSQQKSFEAVIVYQLDRFSRNRYDSAVYKARLKKHGVKVLSAKENISDDPASIVLESVLEGMAEYYSAELSQKVYRGLTENVLKGKWPGGVIPLGYKLTPEKRLEINPVEAQAVKMAFHMYVDGYKIITIINKLNSLGYRTRNNKLFARTSLFSILKNKRYTGTMIWRDIEIKSGIPAIITENIYLQAQEALKRRKKSHNTISNNYILVGKIICGECGGNMIGTCGTGKSGKVHYYYKCYNKHTKVTDCHAKNIRRDDLEHAVVAYTINMLKADGVIKIIAEQAAKANHAEDVPKIKNIKARIKDLTAKINNYIKAIETGIISNTISKNMSIYEDEVKELKLELQKEEILNKPFNITVDHVKFFLESMLQLDPKAKESQNIIINTFVRKIIVYDDFRVIEVHYNYKNTPYLPDNVQEVKGSFSFTMAED
ncbi:recombinase family protein [Veillonella montpellierensis]|uniref:recombinase family protein n=1 Tax=Veillonella montpellierensis TaxID=187328 RepID=UPI0023F688CC|nr:recombinase family protein [Veillonella montpellierensis]